jgi:FtsP/CotA-like multicopper oxidase with cupredoxin domain
MVRVVIRLFASFLLMLIASQTWAQDTATTALCPRFAAGGVVLPPPDIFSHAGLLSVQFNYNTTVDAEGRNLFCFQSAPTGWEGPTLRINPGDTLNILATNNVPNGSVLETLSSSAGQCGDLVVYDGTLNIHTHGAPVSPACGQDQVIHTLIGSGESFQYSIPWPYYTPSGLYWYHTHVHGTADPTVRGGASGLLAVGGIQNYFPRLLPGMRERLLMIRDQNIPGIFTDAVPGTPCSNGNGQVVPANDITINYVPLNIQPSCASTPAVIEAIPGGHELWRVAAGGGDSIFDLQILDQNGNPQTLQLVAIDANPTGSQNGVQQGTPVPVTDVLLAPAARSEFIVPTPPPGVTWSLITRHLDAGALGDEFESTTTTTIATIKNDSPTVLPTIPPPTQSIPPSIPPSLLLANQPVNTYRKMYFDEESQTTNGEFGFFVAVVLPPGTACPEPTDPVTGLSGCATDVNGNYVYEIPFDIDMVPGVITTQGAIEQWTIENHTQENHEFHFHQLHFLVLSQNNYPATALPAPYEVGQFLDMIQVPAAPASFFTPTCGNCAGPTINGVTYPFPFYTPPAGASPPSVTIKLDFTGSDIGDFVFHCHILGHEDAGMMQIIRVLPPVAP